MGSGQSVPKDSPLACVLKNLKPLSLIKLKANRLKQLCTQIWPQYQLDNQDRWPEVAHLTLTFSKISLTSLNGMTSGRRSPMPKRFGPFGAGPPYARPAPSAPPEFDPADEPPTYPPPHNPLLPLHPTHLLAPKPLLTPPSAATPSPRLPLPPSFPTCHMVMYPAHVSPERGGRTRRPHQSPCAIFIVRYEPDRRKVKIIF